MTRIQMQADAGNNCVLHPENGQKFIFSMNHAESEYCHHAAVFITHNKSTR